MRPDAARNQSGQANHADHQRCGVIASVGCMVREAVPQLENETATIGMAADRGRQFAICVSSI